MGSMQNTEFILVLFFINYCIIFHMNNCKSTFAHPLHSVALSKNINIDPRMSAPNSMETLSLLWKFLGMSPL